MKEAAANLIHIHGQHEHEVLLKTKNHLGILDSYGVTLGRKAKDEKPKTNEPDITSVKAGYNAEYEKLQSLKSGLRSFGGSDAERDRLIDMYGYQIKEIEDAALREGEDEELAEFKRRMQNFEKINSHLGTAVAAFGAEESGVLDAFKRAVAAISAVSTLDTKIEHMLERAKSIQYDLDDIADTVRGYLEGLEYDEEKFRAADARLDAIKVLKRKYGATVPQIFTFLAETRAELARLTRSADEIDALKKQITAQTAVVAEAAARLTAARNAAGACLVQDLAAQLKDLGMPAARIEVASHPAEPGPSGADEVEFLFSANAGEPVKQLAQIISGGEMSRFMLALKTVTARAGGTPTLVFDEIDTGVGGTMGLAIAAKLAALSVHTQIIAVTHLPQIAAMADTHFLINKRESGGKTITEITELERGAQIEELARMVGSAATGESAAGHARELKKWADEIKLGISGQ
jgi:DNA repair protein RecN (Recombination protein N)